MKRLLPFVAACGLVSVTLADPAPPAMTEAQRIDLPTPNPYWVLEDLALDGEHLMAVARGDNRRGLLAFHRDSDGLWRYTQTVREVSEFLGSGVALRGGVATSDIDGHEIFEYSGGTWQLREGFLPVNGAPYAIAGSDLLLATTPGCEAQMYARSSSSTWVESSLLPGALNTQCFNPWFDIDGGTAVAANRASNSAPILPRIYNRTDTGSWATGALLPYPANSRAENSQVSLRGTRIVGRVSPHEGGDLVWADDGSGNWTVHGRLQAADAFESEDGDTPVSSLIAGGEGLYYQLGNATEYGRGQSVIRVFRELANGQFKHFLTFKNSEGTPLVGPMVVSGRGVLVGGVNEGMEFEHAYYFEVPPEMGWPPELVQETFDNGASNWRPSSGSAYSVVTEGGTQVYRQSNLTRSTVSTYAISTSLRNQGIEADIVPRQFASANRWVGLVTRRTDGNNFYYLSLVPPRSVYFKRVKNGVTTVLAGQQTPREIVAGQRYRVRLESIGDWHRMFVDGKYYPLIADSQLSNGAPGLATYQASADFDNVLFGRGALLTLRRQLRGDPAPQPSNAWWTNTGSGQWSTDATNAGVTQSSLAGTARRLTGAVTDTQIITVDVRPTQFAPSSAGLDPWVGVIARYVDDRNYYYLSLRDSNQVSLRKRVSDNIVGLGTRTLDVAPNQTYQLKLEVVGSRLRAYVNNALILEREDLSHAKGSYGLITYQAAARFSNFEVYQP